MIGLAPSPVGTEALDEPDGDPGVARATLRDIAVVNRLFGGRRAVAVGFRVLARGGAFPKRPLTLLDVGAGAGDVARHLVQVGARRDIHLVPIAIDIHPVATVLCRDGGLAAVRADAGALPLSDGMADIVVVSQVLHHFSRRTAAFLVRRLSALSRIGVIVSDIRRTRVAAAGIWIAAHALRLHPVTRHDGIVSVRRGFTRSELASVLAAAGVGTRVMALAGFRLAAAWRTDRATG